MTKQKQEKLQKELHSFQTQLAHKFQYLDEMTVAYKDQPEMIQRYVDGMKHDRQLIDEWTKKLQK